MVILLYLQFNKFTKNKDWRMAIDPINNKQSSNWFAKNKLLYGNGKKILICIIIAAFIESIFLASLLIWQHEAAIWLLNILYFVGMMIILALARKIYNFTEKIKNDDKQSQFRKMSIISIVILIVVLIVAA